MRLGFSYVEHLFGHVHIIHPVISPQQKSYYIEIIPFAYIKFPKFASLHNFAGFARIAYVKYTFINIAFILSKNHAELIQKIMTKSVI